MRTHERPSAHGAILLAAGASTRLGTAKQLIEIDGVSLLRHAAEALLATAPRVLVVVLGHEATTMRAALAPIDAHVVIASDHAEGLSASLRAGLAVALLSLALANRAVLPGEPEPLEIADDLLFSARHVSLRIGVVDPEQHPVAEAAVGDGAEGVTDVQGAGRTGCEADSLHRGPSLRAASTAPTG
jgi:hypothetical protein